MKDTMVRNLFSNFFADRAYTVPALVFVATTLFFGCSTPVRPPAPASSTVSAAVVPVESEHSIPADAIPRLETGMHGARIGRVDNDAAGALLITSSYDKTARLWDAATGELIRVLRIPISDAEEGQLRAAALSPDGHTAVVGGWTRYGGRGHTVFFIDAATAEIDGTVVGFENVIWDLEFSPDGSYIAVATGNEADLAVIDAGTREVFRRLSGCREASFGVTWAPDGRLAAASVDGNVCLFDSRLELARRVRVTGGDRPIGIAFSPDGSRIAVGYEDSNRVQVLDGTTLDLLYEPDTTGVREGRNIAKVDWSPDGHMLYAGGTDSRRIEGGWKRYLRVWQDAGTGAYRDIGIAGNTILDVKTLPDGRVGVTSAQPDFSLLTREGLLLWQQDSRILDYNVRDDSFLRISPDGRTVGAASFGDDPFEFSSAERRVLHKQSAYPPPRDRAGSTVFSSYRDSRSPALNGSRLTFLRAYEMSRSVSVNSDGSFAVLGADWSIYGVNADGSVAWSIPVPGILWAVNIAANDRVFAGAFADGTIRWYRVDDGGELLAFFLHADRTRWIAWTPSGYYDSSADGDDLIGFHHNDGLEGRPEFVPASDLRERFHRPDIVAGILVTFDEEEARTLFDAREGSVPSGSSR